MAAGRSPRENTPRDWGFRLPPSRRQAARYSRFVGIMRIVLPALAVSLLALIVLWPSIGDRTADLTKSLEAPEIEGVRPEMTNPRYYGTDKNNLPFSIRAEKAIQLDDTGEIMSLQSPSGEMTLDDGTVVVLEARMGYYDRLEQVVTLKDGVDLRDSRGYEVRTSEASIDLRSGIASGDAPVEGKGPFGEVRGDGFEWRKEDGVLRLTGPANLRVAPERERER